MANVKIRNLLAETHRALKLRAVEHGRSTEAEMRAILESAVQPTARLGTALTKIGSRLSGVELDITRDAMPADMAGFE